MRRNGCLIVFAVLALAFGIGAHWYLHVPLNVPMRPGESRRPQDVKNAEWVQFIQDAQETAPWIP